MFDIICEDTKCSSYEKCIQYEKKHKKNKCIKQKQYQKKACHHDKHNTCIKCNNFKNCIIPLEYNEKLKQIQYRISDIQHILKEEGYDDYLQEELRTLRLKEKQKTDYLRRKYTRKHQ